MEPWKKRSIKLEPRHRSKSDLTLMVKWLLRHKQSAKMQIYLWTYRGGQPDVMFSIRLGEFIDEMGDVIHGLLLSPRLSDDLHAEFVMRFT